MKILLISTWTNISINEQEYNVVDSRGNENENIIKDYKPSLAEYSFLKEDVKDVKMIILLPSFLTASLNDLPDSYSLLVNSLKDLVAQKFPAAREADIYVLPSSGTFKSSNNVIHIHDGGIGNFNFFIYTDIYEELRKEDPEVVMVDLSETSSYLSYITSNAVRLAIEDYA
ncbi:MAG: TM1812 family CRISPR-associated protein, partial [Sulfolobaceae archaeon]